MSTSPLSRSQLVSMFRDHFVVEVVSARGPTVQLGSGVLLRPRVGATCRHVVEEDTTVPPQWREAVINEVLVRRRNSKLVRATALNVRREGAYDDVAFLVLEEPLGLPTEPFPRLVAGVSDDVAVELCKLMGNDREMLRAGGFINGLPDATAMAVRGHKIGPNDLVSWYELGQGQAQNASGGPLWIASTSQGAPGHVSVIGLMAVDANPRRSTPWIPGVLGSGAVASDSLLTLRTSLLAAATPEYRELLDGIDVALASEVVAALRGRARELESELWDELANVFHERSAATTLLHRVGFPPASIPPPVASGEFWTQVAVAIRGGALENGVEEIGREAARRYPSNPVFGRFRR